MAAFKHTIDTVQQTKQLVAGGTLMDIVHVDYRDASGFPGFVDVPLGAASKENIDKAIQDKIQKVQDILSLGK